MIIFALALALAPGAVVTEETTNTYTIVAPIVNSDGNMITQSGRDYLVYQIKIEGFDPATTNFLAFNFALQFDNTKLRINQETVFDPESQENETRYMLYPNFSTANNARILHNVVADFSWVSTFSRVLIAGAFAGRAVPLAAPPTGTGAGADVLLTICFEILGAPAAGTEIPLTFTKADLTVAGLGPTYTEIKPALYTVGTRDGAIIIGEGTGPKSTWAPPAQPASDPTPAPTQGPNYTQLQNLYNRWKDITPIVVHAADGEALAGIAYVTARADKRAFDAALADAKEMLEKRNAANQAAIDVVYNALFDAASKINWVADKARLAEAIAYAQEYIDYEQEYAFGVSENLQKKRMDAIDNAWKVYNDPNATPEQINAAINMLDALAKTGESGTIFVLASALALALAGLACVMIRRRRYAL
ncbi:MAG: LPXTG cell wall anchor domain-containing protein [Clostridiales bacterium]|nr:LPXTG cell wall anchor domain-containing protein [Clostridiales bacterium]